MNQPRQTLEVGNFIFKAVGTRKLSHHTMLGGGPCVPVLDDSGGRVCSVGKLWGKVQRRENISMVSKHSHPTNVY